MGSRISNAAKRPSALSNFINRTFSSPLFTTISNFVTGGSRQQTQATQNTVNVNIIVPASNPTQRPTTPILVTPIIVQGPRASIVYPGDLRLPTTSGSETARGITASSQDIGIAVDIGTSPIHELDDDFLDDGTPQPRQPISPTTIAQIVSTTQVPEPAFFTPSNLASTSIQTIHDVFVDRVEGLTALRVVNSDFRAASTTQRTASIVELFTEISIPGILSAITQAPGDFLRSLLGRGAPEARVVTTELPDASTTPLPTGAAPTFDSPRPDGTVTAPRASATNNAPDNATIQDAPPRAPEAIRERLEKEPGVAFRDASPVHRTDSYVPLVQPSNIYPNIVPVPVRADAAADAPGMLELVIQNGAKELRNLASTLWNFILPPRE